MTSQQPGATPPPSLSALAAEAGAPAPGPGNGQPDSLPTSGLRNRAGQSSSPYVRAHAESPVKWQLLDDEAVGAAKRENKLLFLNIGFRSCHYCRLTTQDSFSHPSVASLLNDAFIPVMVDREERPDIDTIYMNYIQAVNGVGGWPINVFLTPELEPVFGGTYWPGPGSEHDGEEGADDGRLDFVVILQKMGAVWIEQEARCRKEAREIVSQLREIAAEGTFGARSIDASTSAAASGVAAAGDSVSVGPSATVTNFSTASSTRGQPPLQDLDLDLDQLEEAFTHVAGVFDAVHGGFGAEPKFPTPARLSFLLRLSRFPSAVADVVGEDEVRHASLMALHTLRRIRDGGLRDHVGGGFARYSATADWTMPHFEKMVADNALLLGVYLDAWLGQAAESGSAPSADDEFADVVLELGDYLTSAPILREEGRKGFASSEAADSFYGRGDRHMREGAYYLWTRRELDAVVGSDDGGRDGQQASSVAAAHWNVLQHGNVAREHDPHDDFMNQNVLSVVKSAAELSRQFGIPVAEVRDIVADAKRKLLAHRQRERVRPATDDKAVASYNGMAIASLARTAAAIRSVDAPRSATYLDAATRAAEFVRDKLWNGSARVLYRSYHESRGETRGFADDYAFVIEGLLELAEATGDESWLKWADELQETQINLFYDPPNDQSPATPIDQPPTPSQRSSSGAFYSTEEAAPHTILRLKDGMDTAQPSTNGTAVSNLFRLGAVLRDDRYTRLARETITAFEAETLQYPWLFLSLLSGVVAARLSVRSWVVVGGSEGDEDAERARRTFYTAPRAEPRGLVYIKRPVPPDSWLLKRNPALQHVASGSGCFEWKDDDYRPAGP